jgi:hypothetical protein
MKEAFDDKNLIVMVRKFNDLIRNPRKFTLENNIDVVIESYQF